MPNSRQTSDIASPSSNFATNRKRSSITEHSFHGLDTSRSKAESVTYVSGTPCYLCLGPLISVCPWLWYPWAAKVRTPLSANHSKSPTDYAREEKTPPAIAQAARDALGGTWHGRPTRMRQSAR